MKHQQLLKQLDKAWQAFHESFAGLTPAELEQPGVIGDWSVKDILAHVTSWDNEALKHLPLVIKGGRPERYSVKYGGINAFNAQMIEQKRGLSLATIVKEFEETHRRLLEFIESARRPASANTRARRRLRLDTYSHYPKHTKAILKWREV